MFLLDDFVSEDLVGEDFPDATFPLDAGEDSAGEDSAGGDSAGGDSAMASVWPFPADATSSSCSDGATASTFCALVCDALLTSS